ncbi:MAG TPA: type I restriction-modification system subunit M [Candidatus Cloacimonadota bacterium]|nr:type I restriction-modification system subunit M [Candidatus Cloacimonadota bacterium]
MAIKKSELYSSLWASCDELRGGMDASQYKDYVLVMLFLKYISDKWAGQPYAPITIPSGSSFRDMIALKGKTDIGDQINKKIIAPIAEANKLSDMPDFADVSKLGSGKEMVDRLTNLIGIFENPALDFSKNHAEGDDILGDAYEYLMRHFATESGKSKGQFYTPAEVSRIMAKIIGINNIGADAEVTVYDPTCGSGSLLLRVVGECIGRVALYGQEKEATTAGLARMNMILHDNPTAEIKQGNTLANPLFEEAGNMKTFDFVVANPPFSDKRWSNGLTLPEDNPYNRFSDYGVPPEKNGDFAFLLHIVRSLKRCGKGACILPHGVLFRGNAEAEIRKNLIKKGYIKGIIGLPANLFYGTGIPASIIVIDKENAVNRKGIFIIDAGKGFIKDGNKNRLREQDIHKIADVFNNQRQIDGFSRMVSFEEIQKNEYNLNIPRYIENLETEDVQDIEAHLLGGIPNQDIDALHEYWQEFPNLKSALFSPADRPKYADLKVTKDQIKQTIFGHPEFQAFTQKTDSLFHKWKISSTEYLKNLSVDCQPKEIILEISEGLLSLFDTEILVENYDIYQHLMNYWNATMQDDIYIISSDGWKAETYRILVGNKQGKLVDKGWTCDLIPKELVVHRFFTKEKEHLDSLEAKRDSIDAEISELEEEYSGEEGYFADFDKINKVSVAARIRELKSEKKKELPMAAEPSAGYGGGLSELDVMNRYLLLSDRLGELNKQIKASQTELEAKLYAQYPKLSVEEIKALVVDDKWMQSIEVSIKSEVDQTSQHLTTRIKELAERYESPLPSIDAEVIEMESKVNAHLQKMGFVWK